MLYAVVEASISIIERDYANEQLRGVGSAVAGGDFPGGTGDSSPTDSENPSAQHPRPNGSSWP
jgi:hypothetical protein